MIDEISFFVFGCAAVVACGSMTNVLAKGRASDEVLQGLPPEKQHCSNFGVAALRQAITHYRQRVKG